MSNVSLKWCPTSALKEFAQHHWYYLPEAMHEGEMQEWCETMREIRLELDERKESASLQFLDMEKSD